MRQAVRRSSLPLLLAAALGPASACTRPTGAASPAPGTASPAAEEVVADVGGRRITLRDVDQRAAGGLQRLAQEEYELRQQALQELVSEKLVEQEATARGVSPEALVKAEVADKLPPATPAQVRLIYERSRDRLGNRSFAEVAPHIERSLREQARAAREAEFHQQLRSRSAVRITLQPPRATVAVPADAPAVGPESAPVTLVEFLDYQCPYCHKAQEVVDQVLARYQGRVRFVHRDFLLGRPRSLPAARAARCAGEQGKFWEYHRDLLTRPGDMSDADLMARAASLKLEAAAFAACVGSDRHDQVIQQAVEDGHALGITGTPTFFVNGRRLVGAQPLERFQELMDAELKGS
jgi:protein-disulfide isomerase